MQNDKKEMSFWEHLEELRWTLLKIIGTIIVFALACTYFADHLLKLCTAPLAESIKTGKVILNQTGPFDGIFIKMKTGLLFGFALSFSFTVLFLWNFISPGLTDKEKKSFWWIFASLNLLFFLGLAFGYGALFFVLPVLLSFGVSGAENIWRLNDYLSFFLYWELCSGLVMELPLVLFIFVKLGLIKLDKLKKARPYAFLIAFVFSAVITADPLSLLLLGFLFYLLFELGILISSLQKVSTEH